MAASNAKLVPQGQSDPFRFWQNPGFIWGVASLCLAVFSGLSSFDLNVSQQLFTPGVGFTYAETAWVMASYEWTPLVGRTILGLLLLLVLLRPWAAFLVRRYDLGPAAQDRQQRCHHMAVIALLCALLGPGLVIEAWFKQALCRPRPVQVAVFGGDSPFQAAPQRRTHPEAHRSFVSSHAAAGFWLMSLGLTAGPTWRRRWFVIGIVTGAAIGLGRILQGGHFLTDIIFAFYAVWIPCEIVAALDRRWQRR
ncbi:phosphatase PAP2 family protein [Aquabacterium sp. CECT 9606]|uniref:phosphatase PAP2 family protein n=1 Tax=Aquabacterium sp. CECT 9606 TaxID=2845822 RepID=UPI001E31D7D4|nr:phosphatase PAP2 family protein [Aquabacterium sp. CECT 9606]CAH0353391.1 hypothetical protein AQB9606_03207 [Aquabacterium sp. CECT 9606]